MNEEFEKLRRNEANWHYSGLVYRSAGDPRLIVPMRVGPTGYAMNFAHSESIPVLVAILLALLTPLALPFVFGFPRPLGAVLLFVIVAAALAGLCHWEATRAR